MPSTAPQFNGKVSNSLIHQQVRVRRVNETVARCAGLLQCNTRRQGSSTDSRCAGTGIAPSAGWNHPDPETPLLPRPLPKAALLALLLALPGPLRAGESLESAQRSEEHTSELQSLLRISYAGFCLKKKN